MTNMTTEQITIMKTDFDALFRAQYELVFN